LICFVQLWRDNRKYRKLMMIVILNVRAV
jgi:hypothetical protein